MSFGVSSLETLFQAHQIMKSKWKGEGIREGEAGTATVEVGMTIVEAEEGEEGGAEVEDIEIIEAEVGAMKAEVGE